jgi:hypothetical protein
MPNESECHVVWIRRTDGFVVPSCGKHNLELIERAANSEGPEREAKIVECPKSMSHSELFMGAAAEWERLRTIAQRDLPSNAE